MRFQRLRMRTEISSRCCRVTVSLTGKVSRFPKFYANFQGVSETEIEQGALSLPLDQRAWGTAQFKQVRVVEGFKVTW